MKSFLREMRERQMRIGESIVMFFLLIIPTSAFGGTHSALDFRARSMPWATNLWGTIAYDGLLWGGHSREKPLYGYYSAGARGGGSPSYAGFVQVAPIAPLIFEVQRSYTHRYIKSNTVFDCAEVECLGRVERTDFNAWLLAGHKNLVFVGNAMWRGIQTEEEGRPVALEMEVFTVGPGYHRYFEASTFMGYKLLPNRMIGVLSTFAKLTEDHRRSSSNYAIYRFDYSNYGVSVGVGYYETDQPGLDGISAILGVTRTWSDRLSLF